MTTFADGLEAVSAATGGDHDVIQDALVAIRNHLGMEVAYFSEFVDGRTVFRRVDAPGLDHLIKVGDSHSLADVYCNHILEGRLPKLMSNTSDEPLARSMPITGAVPIGSHVSVPIRLRDGTPFGMFCCLSPRPIPSLNGRDLDTMEVFAGLAARQVNVEIEKRRSARDIRARIMAVISQGQFEIVHQPIFELTGMTLCGSEALCRFSPLPYRSPDVWFNEAAAVDLGVELEIAVIRSALSVLGSLPRGISLSVNASPQTVASGALRAALTPHRLDRVVVEITEHAQVADYDALHRELAPLKACGLKVAADDAGAGYSGLQHIVQLAPDIIKMDMSLTRSVDRDAARRALASAMVFYAGEVGSCVVAEGIETASELEALKRLGANRGQGYLLGRPGPLSELFKHAGATRSAEKGPSASAPDATTSSAEPARRLPQGRVTRRARADRAFARA